MTISDLEHCYCGKPDTPGQHFNSGGRTCRPAKTTPIMTVRLPDELRAELDRRAGAGHAKSVGELIRRAVTEYLDNHPDSDQQEPDDDRLPYDHGDHGRYLPELNALRQAAADALTEAITATITANQPRLGRPPALIRADYARKQAITAQMEYSNRIADEERYTREEET